MKKSQLVISSSLLVFLLVLCVSSAATAEEVSLNRKPGYWIADVDNSAIPGMKVKYKECSNSETECDLKSKKSGSGVLSEMVCSGDAAGQKIKLVATFDAQGDFDKAFTISGDMKMEGLPMPPIKMVMTYKYHGACPEGMKVGDMITEGLPSGPVKINLLEQ